MAETVNWSFSSAIDKGPTLSGSDRFQVDGYDKLSVTLPAGNLDTKVDILPSGSAGPIRLLVVKASTYDAAVIGMRSGSCGNTMYGLFCAAADAATSAANRRLRAGIMVVTCTGTKVPTRDRRTRTAAL